MVSFSSYQDLINAARKQNKPISRLALEYEVSQNLASPEAVVAQMQESLKVMRQAVASSLRPDVYSTSCLSGGDGYKVYQRLQSGGSLVGDFLGSVLYSALCISETNASMGKIVAAPTAGSCGILPACLLTLQKAKNLTDLQVAEGLLHASAVGIVIALNASISGAEGGCQAECGSAAAMAASAMTELMGGTPEMCGHACATALKSLMGLVCDPVAGLVEEPCIIRNASCAAVAVSSAELALSGVKSLIPVDEVIAAMKRVGDSMPEALRETAQGGIAASETGKELTKKLFAQ